MASAEKLNSSDEIITVKCCVCAEKGITREADNYCIECQDYYCIPCSETHKIIPSLKGHKLLDKADFNTTGLDSELPCFPTERCAIHTSKLLEMFCANHDEVICTTCVALYHRKCLDVYSIPDEIDNLCKTEANNQTKRDLTTLRATMEELKKAREDEAIELKTCLDIATDSIKEHRREIEIILSKIEKDSIKAVKDKYSTIEAKLMEEIVIANNHIDQIDESADKLRKSKGNKAQEFVSLKAAEKVLANAQNSTKQFENTTDVEIVFEADTKIQSFFQQMATFGKVYVNQKQKCQQATIHYNVKQQREINVSLKNDRRTCNIQGCCLTGDGYLLLADYSNKKLKRVGLLTESIMDSLNLRSPPDSVCLISKDEAAVSIDNTIQFVSLGTKMQVTRQLNLNDKCYGLTYNDGKLIVTNYKDAVNVYDINGTVLQKITVNSLGDALFKFGLHVTVNPCADRIYIADTDVGLVALDLQGNYVSTFTDPELKRPRGVCTDEKGNVFACGLDSENIVQIDPGMMRIMSVFGMLSRPLSLCFDSGEMRLFVTESVSNMLKVLEIE